MPVACAPIGRKRGTTVPLPTFLHISMESLQCASMLNGPQATHSSAQLQANGDSSISVSRTLVPESFSPRYVDFAPFALSIGAPQMDDSRPGFSSQLSTHLEQVNDGGQYGDATTFNFDPSVEGWSRRPIVTQHPAPVSASNCYLGLRSVLQCTTVTCRRTLIKSRV